MTVTLLSVEGLVRCWFRSYPFGHGLSQLPLIQISGGVLQKEEGEEMANTCTHKHGQACKVSYHDSKPGAELTSSVTHRPQVRALSRTHRAGR